MGLFPLIATLNTYGGTNRVSTEMTKQAQSINTQFVNATSEEECTFFVQSLISWVVGVTGGGSPRVSSDQSIFLLYLSVEPIRCNNFFPVYDGNVTASFCRLIDTAANLSDVISEDDKVRVEETCSIWRSADSSTSVPDLASLAKVRTGAVNVEFEERLETLITATGDVPTMFRVTAKFNHTYSVQPA